MTDTKRPESKERLIEGLNEDLANEWAAVISYLLRAQTVRGPHRPVLSGFFDGEVGDELGHARFLARKIDALGGHPTHEPAAIAVGGGPKAMLEAALSEERATVARYEIRIAQARDAGESALALELETLLTDEAGHVDELAAILDGWEA
ncbi:MAG: ferritin-like domain-containing protein [Gemmatimonadota bacterium]